MKKILLALLACGLAALASAAQPSGVLESSTNPRTGNTTTLSVSFGSFRKLPDGSTLVVATPLVVVTDSEGNEIKREPQGADITVTLTAQQSAPILALFAAAYSEQKAAEAARLAALAAQPGSGTP